MRNLPLRARTVREPLAAFEGRPDRRVRLPPLELLQPDARTAESERNAHGITKENTNGGRPGNVGAVRQQAARRGQPENCGRT
eukprot:818704-Pleurochrysis_carterae.AAC.1